MYHSITFKTGSLTYPKNTWDDWHLVPSSRPLFVMPERKTHTIDIPSMNGELDFSESLTLYPVYGNRKGEIEFYVMNGYQEWYELYSAMANYFAQFPTLRAYLEDDPDHYYEGRFRVKEWNSEKDYSKVIIEYDVGPYKWHRFTSENNPDYTSFVNVEVPGNVSYVSVNVKDAKVTAPAEPKIIASDFGENGATVEWRNGSRVLTYIVYNGTTLAKNLSPAFVLFSSNRSSSIRISANDSNVTGHITFDFKIGSL